MIKVNDKVMIPQDDHPEINFVGLLIGPRGNTLKCKLGCIRISHHHFAWKKGHQNSQEICIQLTSLFQLSQAF